jgi:hypothetical protein
MATRFGNESCYEKSSCPLFGGAKSKGIKVLVVLLDTPYPFLNGTSYE